MVKRPLFGLLAPVGVGVIATAMATWRLMPGVGLWDTAEFQTIPPLLGTAHPTGYPTYVILGWLASIVLAPFGEPAFRMNLLSAILVGVAAGITVDLVRLLTRSTIIGVATGLGLAATPIVWAIGTHADPHALHLVFLAAILWLLVRWESARLDDPSRADRWLVAAAAVTGLSAGNHSLTLLLAVPIGLFVLAVEPSILARGRFVALCVAAFVLAAALVYLELPLRGGAIGSLKAPFVYGRPDTLGGFVYVVTGEQFRGGLNDPFGDWPGKLASLASLAIRQLGPLAALVLSGLIVTAIRRRAFALLTASALAITCFFNAAYVNAEIDRYYLGPALIAWVWIAIFTAAVVDRIREGRLVEAPDPPSGEPSDAAEAPVAIEAAGGRARGRFDRIGLAVAALAALLLVGPTIVAFPDRAAAVDRTADRSAELWLAAVLDEVEPGAVIVSWWSYSTPLWYAQLIEGRRPDVFVADDRTRIDMDLGEVTDVIDDNLAIGRPVYAIRIDSQELLQLNMRYTLTPLASPMAWNILRVTSRSTAGVRP
jgi:transmembrane protein TMEM260 (protein O-mannosyltransferase)